MNAFRPSTSVTSGGVVVTAGVSSTGVTITNSAPGTGTGAADVRDPFTSVGRLLSRTGSAISEAAGGAAKGVGNLASAAVGGVVDGTACAADALGRAIDRMFMLKGGAQEASAVAGAAVTDLNPATGTRALPLAVPAITSSATTNTNTTVTSVSGTEGGGSTSGTRSGITTPPSDGEGMYAAALKRMTALLVKGGASVEGCPLSACGGSGGRGSTAAAAVPANALCGVCDQALPHGSAPPVTAPSICGVCDQTLPHGSNVVGGVSTSAPGTGTGAEEGNTAAAWVESLRYAMW
jgi:hypothetical protein